MSESTEQTPNPPTSNPPPIEEEYVPTEEIKEFADELYEEFKDLLVSLNINVENFILIVTKCMERVNKIKKLNDQEKYATTILIVNQLVEEVPNTDETDRYYLRNMVPSLIRIVIDASDGKLKLNIKKVKRKYNVDVKRVIEDLYEQQLSKYGLTQRDFIIRTIPALTPKGSTRQLYTDVKDLTIGDLEDDELNEGMKKTKIEFTLGKGCYATVVVELIFEI